MTDFFKLDLDDPNALPGMLWGGGTGLVVVLVALAIGLVNSTAVVAFLGVILGAAISAIANIVMARAQHREELRRVVADDRFRAHQEAYEHWYKMKGVIHTPKSEVSAAVADAQDWWNKNNLYLDQPAREAFWQCMHLVDNYGLYYHQWRHATQHKEAEEADKAEKELREAWDKVMGTGDVLAKCVELPGLAGEEQEERPEPPEEGRKSHSGV